MTVTSLGVRNEFTASSGQTVFNYTFLIFSATDLNVYITTSGATADDSTDITTAYTVTSGGLGNPNGGSITLDVGATANDLVTIVSNITNSRTTDYQSSGDFDEETVNNDFDRTLSLVKQQLDSTGRTLSFPQSLQNATQLTLPVPVAGNYVVWNANATGLENTGAPGTIITNDLTGTAIQMIANTSLVVGNFVSTTGYNSDADGGDNFYKIVAASTGTDDGGSFIDLSNGLQAKGLFPAGVVSVSQFGAIGDGNPVNKTVNLAAFNNAWAFSDNILIPPGDFAIEAEAFYIFTPPADGTLYGTSFFDSIITLIAVNTNSRSIFRLLNGGFLMKDVSVIVDAPVAASIQLFSMESSGVRIQDCNFHGGNTASNANLVNFMTFLDTNTANINVKNSDISNFQRVIFRTTVRTGSIGNVEFSNNEIHDLGEGGLQFNCPGTPASNIRILGNHFREFHSGSEKIFCGGASVHGCTISGNIFNDNANECIHFEEDGRNLTITGNVFSADARGISLFSNDALVSGTVAEMAPKRVTITGNTFFDASLTRTHTAIYCPITSVGVTHNIDSYEDLIVSDNTFLGYDIGILTGKTAAKISNNVFRNCDIGASSSIPWPELFDNTFDTCTLAVSSIQGGMIGNNKFINPVSILASVGGSRVSMMGFKVSVEVDVNLPATTTTSVNTNMTVGGEFFGVSKVMVYLDASTQFHHRISETSYDGATLTDTEKMRLGSGSISFVGLVNNSGAIAVSLNNTTGSAVTLKMLSYQFDGLWVSAS